MEKEETEVNAERRRQFEKYVQEQDRAREETLHQKKLRQDTEQNQEEKMLVIQKHFRDKTACSEVLNAEIEKELASYKNKKQDYASVLALFNELKKYYLQVNYALNTFDRQNYKEALQRLLLDMTESKKKLEPRRKFRFSRRDQDFGVNFQKVKETEGVHKEGYENTIPGLNNLTDSTHILESADLKKPFKITNCKGLTVELRGFTDILFLKNLQNCTVKAGPTKSTVFVDHCVDCTFEIACHQLRIHNTTGTKFGVFTTSKAIIEDTTAVQFHPYSFEYPTKVEDWNLCSLEGKENLWRQIQDFNWLKQEVSPNFQLLDS